jgi:hypothetical protein
MTTEQETHLPLLKRKFGLAMQAVHKVELKQFVQYIMKVLQS